MKAKLLFSSILILMLNVVLAKSVTNLHTKNTLDPIVTMTGDATICPGNNAILTIIGTPNSIVTITNSNFFVYTAFIPQSGTVLFTTPILQETTTFSIIEIKEYLKKKGFVFFQFFSNSMQPFFNFIRLYQ